MSELRQAVKQYLDAISAVSRVGTPELSHYTALDNFFDAVGGELTPKVRAVVHYSETASGQPDLGFFSGENTDPDRGVVEVKGADADLDALIASEQVDQYWQARKLVLVTNLREFALVGQDNDGAKATLERYSLADSVAAFDDLLEHTTRAANRHGVSLGEYLLRVMSHRSTISEPRDLARLLASYARDALMRIERAADKENSLNTIRAALEQALGMTFESARGEGFFRSTLVQTLFYGVFAAWVLWSRAGKTGHFRWKDSVDELHVPFMRMLFHQITDPGRLERLNLVQVLDWTEAAFHRVDRDEFLKQYSHGEAVQYFYEPFLEAFDPQLRKRLGVWYTPRKIVRYMVARVDRALRDDLGIADGLADERVVILDPCCGTGAFLVETLNQIAETLSANDDALALAAVHQAATERVFGFEIMPAPLVIAHLEVGLALERIEAGLSEKQQDATSTTSLGEVRAGVLLTNALTGWNENTTEPLDIPELEQERKSAAEVKQQRRILVVLGNPPYNGFPGVPDVPEEQELTEVYREVKAPGVPAPEGQGLNDLYARFFRMAERRITEKTGQGVVCFISNYSWLDGLSFPGMRQQYLDIFDIVRIDNLNGDKYRTGKLTPDNQPDPSVFSTPEDPVGIQNGTAIATLVRKEEHIGAGHVDYRELWGARKLDALDEDAHRPPGDLYEPMLPIGPLGLIYAPKSLTTAWLNWPSLPDLFPTRFSGVKTSRDSFLVDIDRNRLEQRVSDYFCPSLNHDDIASLYPTAMDETPRFPARKVRDFLLARVNRHGSGVRQYAYRPFDVRWLYWDPDTKLLDERREEYEPHVFPDNVWIEGRKREPRSTYQRGTVVRAMADNFGNGLSSWFPLYRRDNQFGEEVNGVKRSANISELARSYIELHDATPEDLFHHVLATLHDPAYREANAEALRVGWPRIPMPTDSTEFLESAERGLLLARLLDTDSEVEDLLDPGIAVRARCDGTQWSDVDLFVTAGWGHYGAEQAVMPGQGKIERRGDMVDVYLNNNAYWRDVPTEVWEYRLGGYQVLKKWLSYRESKVLGRALEVEEVKWFSEVARRIAAILEIH